jgi:hypothetical protein
MLFEKAEVFKTVNGVIFIYSGLPREKASPDRLKAQLEISPAYVIRLATWSPIPPPSRDCLHSI